MVIALAGVAGFALGALGSAGLLLHRFAWLGELLDAMRGGEEGGAEEAPPSA